MRPESVDIVVVLVAEKTEVLFVLRLLTKGRSFLYRSDHRDIAGQCTFIPV